MNRIYQGRVTKVEFLDGKLWKPLSGWQAALWNHHELFQDAVNYYMLALAAMAAKAPEETSEAHAIREWAGRVADSWSQVSRRAERFAGPQTRLAPLLGLPPDADFETAAARVLGPSRATPELRGAAALALLREKGDLNSIAVSRIRWFATRAGKLDATPKSASTAQEAMRQKAARATATVEDAKTLDLGLFLTRPPTQSATGEEARKILAGYFASAQAKRPELAQISTAFEKYIAQETARLTVPRLGRKPSGLYPFAALARFYPCPETLAAFTAAANTLISGKDKAAAVDPIAEARVDDQPQFEYFTNLALSHRDGDGGTHARWFELDLAAFIDAIKAPRRYRDDTVVRNAQAEDLRRKIFAMEGRGGEAAGEGAESRRIDGFQGDTRVALLRHLVERALARLGDTGGDADDVQEYTIRRRTLRGYGEIKRLWRAAGADGTADSVRLLAILKKEQGKHADDFGSAEFFQALAQPEFQPIWRDPGSEDWHADDPVKAWLVYKELQAELRDKERPIRFTPAHAVYSPRFFVFPKTSQANAPKRTARTPKPGLKSRHEPAKLGFTAGIVFGGKPTVLRLHYAAPRLLRDGLRSAGEQDLFHAPWLQPMMAALGRDPQPVNFANCAVTLLARGPSDIQLTFPVEVPVTAPSFWANQFNLRPESDRDFRPTSLRWPHEKAPKRPPLPWYEETETFSCLATDLGQRDAGAFARLQVSSAPTPGGPKTRVIGQTPGKTWHARVERLGLFRLPGEDALAWRARSPLDRDIAAGPAVRQELWGERGRPARPWEAAETAALMAELEAPPPGADGALLPADWERSLSFPEQNDKLLIALRRYQTRIARLHRWCWFLRGDQSRSDAAWREIAECDDEGLFAAQLRDFARRRDPRLIPALESALRQRLDLAPKIFVRLANRILPRRTCSWQLAEHPASSSGSPLFLLAPSGPSLTAPGRPVWLRGQRGLSFERVEQITELRVRAQSLNSMLRRPIGGEPPLRRDETVPDVCPEILRHLDRLKRQRAHQTAHLILAEALGLRLAPPPPNKAALRTERDQHGIYEKITGRDGDWIGAADFLVIEDLSRYIADQGRSPRENSRLMKWCHREIRDKLRELCQTFGITVVETPAAYSSRFCSRTGVPGFRAMEVSVGFTNAGTWKWICSKTDDKGLPTQEAARLTELDKKLLAAQAELDARLKKVGRPCSKRTLLVPSSGGPIFVPITAAPGPDGRPIPPLLQADMNAAVNLALRAVADPREWSVFPRIRTKPSPGRLSAQEKRRFGVAQPELRLLPLGTKLAEDRRPNFFADLAGLEARAPAGVRATWQAAEIASGQPHPPLVNAKSLWTAVKDLQRDVADRINSARLARWAADEQQRLGAAF